MNTNNADITIDSSEALVAAVPYLIGYHPRQAVVVCALKDDCIYFTANLNAAGLDTVLDDTCATLQRRHVEGCVVIGYDADGDTTTLNRACDAISAAGVEIINAVIASDTTWRSLRCDDPSCCPVDGAPLPDATHPVAVAMIASGKVALADRQALRDLLAPLDSAACSAVAEHMDDLLGDHAALPHVVADADRLLGLIGQDDDEVPDPRACAALAIAAWHPGFFTAALQTGVDEAAASQDRWAWVARHVTRRHRAAALVLCAWAAHQTRHGSLANEAMRQAINQAPDWPTARHIAAIIDTHSPIEAAHRIDAVN